MRRQTPSQKAVTQRITRLKAFSEVLVLAVVIQFVVNWLFKVCGIDLHVAVYEVALIWLFCI